MFKLPEFNLLTSNKNIINNKQANWAQKDGNGQLIYSEHLDRFCRRGSVQDKHISALYDQSVDIQRFLVKTM